MQPAWLCCNAPGRVFARLAKHLAKHLAKFAASARFRACADGIDCSKIRRIVGGRHRPHPQRRQPCGRVSAARRSGRGGGIRNEGCDRQSHRHGQEPDAGAQRAGDGRAAFHRRADDDRAAGHRAAVDGHSGCIDDRRPGGNRDRRCAFQGKDSQHHAGENPRTARRRQRDHRGRVSGADDGGPHHHAGPGWLRPHGDRAGGGAEGGSLPDFYRRRRRLHHRPAHRTDGEEARGSLVRRDARVG